MNRILLLLSLMVAAPPLIAQQLYEMPKGVQPRASTAENLNGVKGAGGHANGGAKGSAFVSLKAGESKAILDVQKAGIIQRIWVTIDDRSPEMLRALRLRMYWDGAAEPAVDVPFGDFFCAAVGRPVAFQSALFTNPEGRSFNCYIPMAFAKGARITLTNGSQSDLKLVFFEVDFAELEKPGREDLYFHASWRRDSSSRLGKDLELLPSVSGRGRYLGVSIGVNVNPVYGKSWWGEGEVKVFLDGDSSHPTLNGTGAEDYIGTGWAEGLFAHSYQGCLVADAPHRQYAFYRWHIPDAIWFYKNCRVTLQQIGGWFGPVVKDMQEKGVPLLPVSISGSAGFRGLMQDSVTAKGLLDKAGADDWVNFYRSDDYSITVYYYLDRP